MGGMISGAAAIPFAIEEARDERFSNDAQLRREQKQANVAIQVALEKGAHEEQKTRLYGAMLQAKQKSAYAASGVDASQGTAAAVQADSAAVVEKDAQQVKIDAAREVWGHGQAKKQSQEEYQARARNIDRKQNAGILGGVAKFVGGGLGMMG